MKWIGHLTLLAILGAGCTSRTELARLPSPDGQAVATLTTLEQRGMWQAGPEPPKVKERGVRLTLAYHGRQVYDGGFENVGVYQAFPFAVDLVWAPGSERLAYRSITTLHIVSKLGAVQSFAVIRGNELISSFKWLDDRELLVVTKRITDPLDMFGYPQHYHGYLAKATQVRIVRVRLSAGLTERFTQPVQQPTFMFHSIGFQNQEISPTSNRVAYSDGHALCVYDDAVGKVIATVPIPGAIEGTWWETNDRLIVGLGLLSGGERRFVSVDLPSGRVEDQTLQLLPRWTLLWNNADWFRAPKR